MSFNTFWIRFQDTSSAGIIFLRKDQQETAGKGRGRRGMENSITSKGQSLWISLCPSSDSLSLQLILMGARTKPGWFFILGLAFFCGRTNQEIAALQALRLELNPFKPVAPSSRYLNNALGFLFDLILVFGIKKEKRNPTNRINQPKKPSMDQHG